MRGFIDRFWKFITSLELTIVLLVLLALGLVFGTVVEAQEGLQAAIDKVYQSPIYDALIALFGLNLIACTLKRYPYQMHQAPWLLTHVGITIILIGAVYGRNGEEDGTLFLMEGEPTASYYIMEEGKDPIEVPIDFTLTLQQFELETYPGTQSASEYRSHIELVDEVRNKQFTQIVKVNHPINYRGYVIAQQSYQLGGPMVGDVSVLSILRNPGMTVLFIGFVVLSVGLILIVFLKPWLMKKFPPRPKEPKPKQAVPHPGLNGNSPEPATEPETPSKINA
ncbi:cytochrome c biogenesis protein ResB [bacterium]|nr:cytochrome c biogenesis protein ResB [bacterium]